MSSFIVLESAGVRLLLLAPWLHMVAGAQFLQTPNSVPAAPVRMWNVRYHQGTWADACDVVGAKSAKLSVTQESIHIACGSLVNTIRADEVVGLDADFRDRVITYGELELDLLVWNKTFLMTATVGKIRVVRVNWRREVTGSEIFDIPEREHKALLNELQNVTGKSWVDLPSLRNRIADEIGRADLSTTLTLGRPASVGPKVLAPGNYTLVLASTTGSQKYSESTRSK